MSDLRFTTSWDDGHPLDLRVAELLAKHRMSGTFYVPRRNLEGRSVLSKTELRTLAAQFEIGGHTFDHVRLDTVPASEVDQQVQRIKLAIENEIGNPVAGFCYPGGAHDSPIRESVKRAGFSYARTISNLHTDTPSDRFQIPTTLQLYPHHRYTYLKNFVRRGHWYKRSEMFAIAITSRGTEEALDRMLERATDLGGVFHLWGHSWEIEQLGLWSVLDRFLRDAAAVVAVKNRMSNADAYV